MLHNEPYNEQGLLLQIAEGDEKAFAELYRKWSIWLSRYIYRLTESTETSEEVLQDVFTKIWSNREMLAEIRNFKAFLLVVTRNQAYMALRRKVREERQLKDYTAEMLSTSEATGMEREYFSALDEAIDQLSERAKEVYILSRQNRLSYQEIADRLGISKESVKTYLQRATTSIIAYIKSKFPELTLISILSLKNFF